MGIRKLVAKEDGPEADGAAPMSATGWTVKWGL